MKRFKDRLEGGYRVVRIRRLKQIMFLIFAVIILIAGTFMMWVTGMSWDPFFLPLDIFVFVALYLLIILTGMNFFFRNLEISYNTRDSQKYLMARNSQSTALIIIIISIFFAVIVSLPATAQTANQILSEDERNAVSGVGDRIVRNFDNQDRLGLFKADWLWVEVDSGGAIIEFCEKADFQSDDVCDKPIFDRTVIAPWSQRIPVPEEGYKQLSLVISNGPATFNLHIERNPSPVFIGVQPLWICIVFAVMNSLWLVYLQPIRKRYSTSSVYSDEYIAALASEEVVPGVEERYETIPKVPSVPRPRKRVPVPPISEPEPSLPGKAFPIPRGAFLNELIVLLNAEADKGQTVSFLRSIVELDPMNKDALLHLGRFYQEDGNYKFAYNEYNRVTKLDPKEDRAWLRRGEVLMAMGKEVDAINSFRKALELNPENTEANEWLHSIRRENQKLMAQAIDRSTNKDFWGAIELYEKILARDPDNLQALLGKGTMYRRLEKWPASLESLNRVLELDPGNLAAIRNKIEVFESVMSWEEALACYDEILERNPDNYLDWMRRGDVLFELSRNEEAIQSYKRAEELKPDSERIRKRLRLLTMPAMEEAVKSFTKIKGIGKSKAIALYEAGFQTLDDLKRATISQLAKIKGISRASARRIKDQIMEEETHQDF